MATITPVDLTPDTFTLTPMVLTDSSKVLVESIIANITSGEQNLEDLAQGSQDKLNEVITAVNDMKAGYDVDFEALEEKIEAILFLESEAGNDSFVGLFTKLFVAINGRKEPVAFTKNIVASPLGKVSVDLTAYGFSALDEFEVIPAVVTDIAGKSIECTFRKVSLVEGELTLRDADRLMFAENTESFYEAEVKGAVSVTVMMVKTATAIHGDLVEVDGDEVHLGHDESYHTPPFTDFTVLSSTIDEMPEMVEDDGQGGIIVISPATFMLTVVLGEDTYGQPFVLSADGADAINGIASDAIIYIPFGAVNPDGQVIALTVGGITKSGIVSGNSLILA